MCDASERPTQWGSTGQVARRMSSRNRPETQGLYTSPIYRGMRDAAGDSPESLRSKSRDLYVGEEEPETQGLYTSSIYTGMRGSPRRLAKMRWRIMISSLRGSALMNSDVRCYECSVRRIIRLSVPFSGTAVKHGKLPVSFIHQRRKVKDLTPVDPAGGHRYRNSIKTCESRVFGTRRTAQ